jgi:hypothetical protein
VEIIHVIVKMNNVPSYALFHNEHVTYALPILASTMNHEILVSLEPIRVRLVIPHVSIISTQTRFVQPTYVVWNTLQMKWGGLKVHPWLDMHYNYNFN